MLKLGIITTIADAADSIDAFIYYHHQIGFQYFYIFVDDNDPETLSKISNYENVRVFINNHELRQAWALQSSKMDPQKMVLVDQEVMVRQELNFHYAFELAKQDGVDWVIHIDLDELFYPNNHVLQDYFADLQFNNIRAVTHLNYESISTQPHSPNIYLSSSYFKVNYLRHKHWFYNTQQKAFIKANSWLREKFFLYYQNGKSSISTYGKHLKFYDVHSIVGDGSRRLGTQKDPLILHYPCARLVDFIKKYHRLGRFSDSWMGHPRAGDFIDKLHLQARDYVTHEEAPDYESFYQEHFLMTSQAIDSLCQLNLAVQIDLPKKILTNINI